MSASVSERLVEFAQQWQARGIPDDVLHEAKRLLLNQLKASVGATDQVAEAVVVVATNVKNLMAALA